jgi:hypothetical protein
MAMAMIVRMAMVVPMRVQGVVVRHGGSLARYWCKVA